VTDGQTDGIAVLELTQYQVSATVMDFVAVPPRCIYACAVVFYDATVFLVNKDLYTSGVRQKLVVRNAHATNVILAATIAEIVASISCR